MGKCGFSIKLVTWYANRTEDAKEAISDEEKTYQFELKGEEPFYVQWKNGEASFAEGTAEKADVRLQGDSDVVFKVLIGEIDQDDAYNTKKIEIVGSIIDATKLRRWADLVQNSESPVTRAELFAMFKDMSGLLMM